MLKNLRKPHGLLLVLVLIFVVAWAVWTLVLLPRSETPYLPQPTQTESAPPSAAP